jgi:hypothetical protein
MTWQRCASTVMRQRSLAPPEATAEPRRTAGDRSGRARTAAAALLLLLAAAHGAAAAPALRLSGRLRPAAGAVREHGAGRAAAEPCIIRAYTAEYLNYEVRLPGSCAPRTGPGSATRPFLSSDKLRGQPQPADVSEP